MTPQTISVLKYKKILVPPGIDAELKKQGLAQVKGLQPKALLQLSKGGSFLFVRAIPGKVSEGGLSGYFLEFDNGRNLLLAGSTLDTDALRTFLYSLRDEGKEIHMAFFPDNKNDAQLAEIIGLLQPQVAVVTGAPQDLKRAANLNTLLKDQMFEGSLFFAQPGDTFPY